MPKIFQQHALAALCALTLAGCASQQDQSIYVPATQHDPLPRQERDQDRGEMETQPQTETPQVPDAPARDVPGYRSSGEALSPAAKGLVQQADQALRQGRIPQAIAQLERAQRISPRSAVVYLKLAEAYVRKGDLGRAEQFTLKGLSQAGDDVPTQRAGWQLLSDIRRARGDREGAAQARARSNQL
ncbi:tetratricopeptide repeat protein [Marinobacteraceae bacterium S3BR75-40.1]